MKFLSADASNNNVSKFNKSIKDGDTVFVIFHSPTCGHCVTTLPIWKEIEHTLKDRYKNNHKVMVADIQDDVIGQTPYGPKIDGFPTIWCISRNGTKIEPIEHAKLMNRPRTIDGFVEWIELKTPLSYNSQTIVSEKRKKRYRVTPFPRRKSSTRKFTNSGTRARKFKTRKWIK